MKTFPSSALVLLVCASLLGGCAGPAHKQVFDPGDQLQTRAYQSRAFATTDREATLRAVIATMQDLGFVIERADSTLGTVSGTKLRLYELRMTVSLRPRGASSLLVRANAQFKPTPSAIAKPIDEPGPYQDFFVALAKALFLEAQQVD